MYKPRKKNKKVEFMSELLYWIAFNCTGVPTKVLSECTYRMYCIFLTSRGKHKTNYAKEGCLLIT